MLHNNIKKVLDDQGRKANYLARKIGIPESHLSNIIRGKITPNIELGLKISKVLEVRVEELFYIEDDTESNIWEI